MESYQGELVGATMSLPPWNPHDEWEKVCCREDSQPIRDDRDHPALAGSWPGGLAHDAPEELWSLRSFELPHIQRQLDMIDWVPMER